MRINPKSLLVFLLVVFELVFAKTSLYQNYHQKNDLVQISSLSKMQKSYARIDLPESYITPEGNFKIHYSLAGSNAVDSIGYVHETGRIAEYAYSLLIDSLGFDSPPVDNIDGNEIDIYIRDWGGTYYAQTYLESKNQATSRPNDYISYMVIDNDYMDSRYETKGRDALQVTIAHEFFHMVQLGYNFTNDDLFFFEWSSVWFEDIAYPEINDYLQYTDFFHYPEESIFSTNGNHHYSLGIFLRYFSINYGIEIIRNIWEEVKDMSAKESLKEVIAEKTGYSLPWHINKFYRTCYFSGSRYHPEYSLLEDAVYFPDFNYSSVDTFDNDDIQFASNTESYGTSIHRIAFNKNIYTGIDRNTVYNDTLLGGYIKDYNFNKKSIEFSLSEDTFIGKSGPEDTLVIFMTNSVSEGKVDYNLILSERDRPRLASKINSVYPNPINNAVGSDLNFTFQTDLRNNRFSASLYNILGQRVLKKIYAIQFESGEYVLPINKELASGVYILQINSGSDRASRKITILK